MSAAEVDGRTVEITHPDRVVFPDAGLTKGDVVDYYRRIAPRILPHLRDRPLVLRRYPEGIAGDGFFHKDAPGHFPSWIRRVTIEKVAGGTVDYVVCDDAATLVYVANQGAVELHTLLGPASRPHHPDRIVLDLDPSSDDLEPVVAGARTIRALLRDLGIVGFVNASGSRGVHVHVLLDGDDDFDVVRPLSHRLAETIVARDPVAFTTEHRKADRGGRLFVDVLRNGFGQHAVVPFSLRARPGAPVAVPLRWPEATASSFDPRAVTARNVFRRLGAQREDPWTGAARHRVTAAALAGRLDDLERGRGSAAR